MPRNRMIKPDFWDDEKMASIPRDARLLFIGMWNHSDDYGTVKGSPKWLKSKIFPYDNIEPSEFEEWLGFLEDSKVNAILPFSHNGEKYYYIRTFSKHQTINRPSKQKNPDPPKNIQTLT